MGMIPQYFHTIPTSCDIFPNMFCVSCMHIQTQHCSCTPQLPHMRQTISAMLSSNYIAAIYPQHNSLPCTSTCTTYLALPTPVPSTTLLVACQFYVVKFISAEHGSLLCGRLSAECHVYLEKGNVHRE